MARYKREEWKPKIRHIFQDGTVMTAEEFDANPPTVPSDHPACKVLYSISLARIENAEVS